MISDLMVAPEDFTVKSKRISIVTHAYNEEANIQAHYLAVHAIMQRYPQYLYEHIFIDNHSTDFNSGHTQQDCRDRPAR